MDVPDLERKKRSIFRNALPLLGLLVFLIIVFLFLDLQLPLQISLFILGVVLLVEGADWVVSTAGFLARSLGIPPLLIGLFVVSFFTSIPEFAVSGYAAYTGNEDLLFGNLIGSVIVTLGLVLGTSALFSPLVVESFTVLLEAPFLLLAAVVLFVLSFRLFDFGSADYVIGSIDGVLLILFFLLFLGYTWRHTVLQESKKVSEEFSQEFTIGYTFFRTCVVFLVGFVAILFGAKFVVSSSSALAHAFGVSDAIIGLTLVSVGTALPEFVVSLVGLMKKEYDLVVGNILGANIITLLLIPGVISLFTPLHIDPHILFIDMIVLIVFAAIFQVFITTDKTVTRREGFILLLLYLLYFGYLVWYALF